MRALSVRQPFATLIVGGFKTLEVRSWATTHRGELLICATAKPNNWFLKDGGDLALMPAGGMLGIVRVVDCRPMRPDDCDASLSDYSPGAYVWVLEPVCEVEPDPVIGKLGLFHVPDGDIKRLTEEDSYFNFEPPQGDVKWKKSSPMLDMDVQDLEGSEPARAGAD